MKLVVIGGFLLSANAAASAITTINTTTTTLVTAKLGASSIQHSDIGSSLQGPSQNRVSVSTYITCASASCCLALFSLLSPLDCWASGQLRVPQLSSRGQHREWIGPMYGAEIWSFVSQIGSERASVSWPDKE